MGKIDRPSQRREMAERVVRRRGVSIALACRTFGVSETCYRYGPKLKAENERIGDLLIGLTNAHKAWGFGLCFLHRRNVKGHVGTTSVFTGFIGIWNLISGSSHASALFGKSLMNWQFRMHPTKAGRWTLWQIGLAMGGRSGF